MLLLVLVVSVLVLALVSVSPGLLVSSPSVYQFISITTTSSSVHQYHHHHHHHLHPQTIKQLTQPVTRGCNNSPCPRTCSTRVCICSDTASCLLPGVLSSVSPGPVVAVLLFLPCVFSLEAIVLVVDRVSPVPFIRVAAD